MNTSGKMMTPSQVLVLGFALVYSVWGVITDLTSSNCGWTRLAFFECRLYSNLGSLCYRVSGCGYRDNLYKLWAMGHSVVDSSGWTRFYDLCHAVCYDFR